MRVVFMGTPELAVTSLDAIRASRHVVVAVVTQPPQPQGRGRRLLASAVGQRAAQLGVDLLEPTRLDIGLIRRLRDFAPDALVVVAYGKLLGKSMLDLAPHGAINVHPSLLPRHRGASPIQHAILAGDRLTGVSIMRLDAGLDTGPILLAEATKIGDDEDGVELSARLATLGATLLVRSLDGLEAGTLEATPQDEVGATYAHKLSADDSWLDWSQSAAAIALRVRGLKPWPVAQTKLNGRRLQVLRVQVLGDASVGPDAATIGTVVVADRRGIEVACGSGCVRLVEAQLEGARAMSARDLLNGRKIALGDRLGD